MPGGLSVTLGVVVVLAVMGLGISVYGGKMGELGGSIFPSAGVNQANCQGQGGTCKPRTQCTSANNIGDDMCEDQESGGSTTVMVCCKTEDLSGGSGSDPGSGSGTQCADQYNGYCFDGSDDTRYQECTINDDGEAMSDASLCSEADSSLDTCCAIDVSSGSTCSSPGFTVNPGLPSVGQDVEFSASPDGCSGYDWTIDRSTTKSGQTVTHSFSSSGTYTVELSTGSGSTQQSVTVLDNRLPRVEVSQTPSDPVSPDSYPVTVEWTLSTDDPDGSVTNYGWSSDSITLSCSGSSANVCSYEFGSSDKGIHSITVDITHTNGEGSEDTFSYGFQTSVGYDCGESGDNFCTSSCSGSTVDDGDDTPQCPSGEVCCRPPSGFTN